MRKSSISFCSLDLFQRRVDNFFGMYRHWNSWLRTSLISTRYIMFFIDQFILQNKIIYVQFVCDDQVRYKSFKVCVVFCYAIEGKLITHVMKLQLIYHGISYLDEKDQEILQQQLQRDLLLHDIKQHISYKEEDDFRDYSNEIMNWLSTAGDETSSFKINISTPSFQYFMHKELRKRFSNVWTLSGNNSVRFSYSVFFFCQESSTLNFQFHNLSDNCDESATRYKKNFGRGRRFYSGERTAGIIHRLYESVQSLGYSEEAYSGA